MDIGVEDAYIHLESQDDLCKNIQTHLLQILPQAYLQQHQQASASPTTNQASNMALDLNLLKVKVLASSTTSKLQSLEQIKNAWEQEDDNEFAIVRLEIALQMEYGMQVSEEIALIAEQLLTNPPSYNDNPSERQHRLLEVLVLTASLHEYVSELEKQLAALRQQVNDTMGTRVEEAYCRVKHVHTEVHCMIDVAGKLKDEEGTQ